MPSVAHSLTGHGDLLQNHFPYINRYLPRIPGKMKKVGNVPSNYTTKIAAAL
jgi:hypothetical protein